MQSDEHGFRIVGAGGKFVVLGVAEVGCSRWEGLVWSGRGGVDHEIDGVGTGETGVRRGEDLALVDYGRAFGFYCCPGGLEMAVEEEGV